MGGAMGGRSSLMADEGWTPVGAVEARARVSQ